MARSTLRAVPAQFVNAKPVPAQYTNDPDVLPSSETLRILADTAAKNKIGGAARYADIREAAEGGDEQFAAGTELLRRMADRMASMRSEQAERAALFQRLDNLYYPETITEQGGADHWPEDQKPGRVHISVNAYPVYVDVPASLQAVIPIENIVG